MVIFFQLGHYIANNTFLEGILTMSGDVHNQDDYTTLKHMIWTFAAFIVLGVFLIILANNIG